MSSQAEVNAIKRLVRARAGKAKERLRRGAVIVKWWLETVKIEYFLIALMVNLVLRCGVWSWIGDNWVSEVAGGRQLARFEMGELSVFGAISLNQSERERVVT